LIASARFSVSVFSSFVSVLSVGADSSSSSSSSFGGSTRSNPLSFNNS